MFLIDTSVWIEVFRKNSKLKIEEIVALDEMVTCLPVVQEVLQGFRDEMAYRRAREAMLAFPCLESPLSLPIYEEDIDLFRVARRRDYSELAKVSSLKPRCL